jgi:hypothetical protein
MTALVASLATTIFGVGLSQLGVIIAQVDDGATGSIGAFVSAGGAAAAVGGIVYIAKLMATGQLVARDPARVEQKLTEVVDQSQTLLRESHVREQSYLEWLSSRGAKNE